MMGIYRIALHSSRAKMEKSVHNVGISGTSMAPRIAKHNMIYMTLTTYRTDFKITHKA
jgi:hypothetical protein